MVEIEDRGIGMSGAGDLRRERAAGPTRRSFDVSISRMMGLYVVGRLAGRHGITVRLRQSETGGVSAFVRIPVDVLASRFEQRPDEAAGRRPGGPAVRAGRSGRPVARPASGRPSRRCRRAPPGLARSDPARARAPARPPTCPGARCRQPGGPPDQPAAPGRAAAAAHPGRASRGAARPMLRGRRRSTAPPNGARPATACRRRPAGAPGPATVRPPRRPVPPRRQPVGRRCRRAPARRRPAAAGPAAGALPLGGPRRRAVRPACPQPAGTRGADADLRAAAVGVVPAAAGVPAAGSAGRAGAGRRPTAARPRTAGRRGAGRRPPAGPEPGRAGRAGRPPPDEDPWASPADEGWRAAERLLQPTSGGTTRAGLPMRVPQAHLMPGGADVPPPPPGARSAGVPLPRGGAQPARQLPPGCPARPARRPRGTTATTGSATRPSPRPAIPGAVVTSLSPAAQNLNWLVTNFVDRVPGVAHAVVVSADGLLLVASEGLPRDRADQLAAVASGLTSLTQGAARVLRGRQRGADGDRDGAGLPVPHVDQRRLRASPCSPPPAATSAWSATRWRCWSSATGDVLTPAVRHELQAVLPR